MIKELEINNFQSHKKTILEFEPGVNVIIGPSDSGKTSLIRALRWIAWNRPLGDAFRSNWGGDTFAVVKFDDGYSVERLEANNNRHYCIGSKNSEEELIFEAFGTEVPEEVQDVLNFSEINIQEQMDSPFLISDNPGQVSRHFNKVANIDKIDSSQKNVESWIRDINSNKKAAEAEIERLEEELKEFDYLDQLEADIEVLESLTDRRNKTHNQAVKVRSLIKSVVTTQEEINEASELLSAEKPVKKLLNLYAKKDSLIDDYNDLVELLDSIEQLEDSLLITKEQIGDQKLVDSLLDLYNKRKKAKEDHKIIRSKITAIKGTKDTIKELKQKLQKLEQKWHEEMPKICPLCETNLEEI